MEGYTQHGGECKTPAHGLAPPRVHVGVIVDQWLGVHGVEDKDALWRESGRAQLLAPGTPPAGPAQPVWPLPCRQAG